MNVVIRTLREHITSHNVRFVFPSQVSSDLWARKTCTLGIVRSVAAERFLAWDRFKKEVIQEREPERKPASLIVKKLFAESLAKKNAKAVNRSGALSQGYRAFKSIIPGEYAANGSVFAPFIARILPSLSFWERLKSRSGVYDAEDEDYQFIKDEYASFLARYDLFEPSWEEITVKEGEASFVIFFPELIEDFDEYDSLLPPPRFIRVNAKEAESFSLREKTLLCYDSALDEIRAAVSEIEKIHREEGIAYYDMAVSVPGLDEMEPWLLKEFFLRQIPVTARAGKNLGEYGAGRLFSLINETASNRFAFNDLKALLLNDHIPWRDREKNKALINFGIKYNCVSGYAENGKLADIWEEALKESHSQSALGSYYGKLKERILALARAESFAKIRENYFAFVNLFLDMGKISDADNDFISRCVEELGGLVDLEEKLNDPEMIPSSPFGFFISCLNEKEYVRISEQAGVNIYKWRVASASPFSCHFVLNASQSAASVLYQPMKFLRQDKRKNLGLPDSDATGAFFALCDTGEDPLYKPFVRISASFQSYSGWTIPHSYFARGRTEAARPCGEDLYGAERRFLMNLQKGESAAFPSKIYKVQKKSFNCWKNNILEKENYFSFFDSAFPAAPKLNVLLENAILGDDNFLTVSPTRDLNVYYKCPVYWLYNRIFKAEEYSLEAALLDDTSLGILYHKILEELFSEIKQKGIAFNAKLLDDYKKRAFEITKTAIKDHPAFKGPLAVPLVYPLAAGMSKKISSLLEIEAKKFDGYKIGSLEFPVELRTGGILIKGIIDRVSLSPDGAPVIFDYKTGILPGQTRIDELDKLPLEEFQMPLYVKLYEKEAAEKRGNNYQKVEAAYFYSIKGKKLKAVVAEKEGGRSAALSRKDYEPFLEAARKLIEQFSEKVNALDFTSQKINIGGCANCEYKSVCRKTYLREFSSAN